MTEDGVPGTEDGGWRSKDGGGGTTDDQRWEMGHTYLWSDDTPATRSLKTRDMVTLLTFNCRFICIIFILWKLYYFIKSPTGYLLALKNSNIEEKTLAITIDFSFQSPPVNARNVLNVTSRICPDMWLF